MVVVAVSALCLPLIGPVTHNLGPHRTRSALPEPAEVDPPANPETMPDGPDAFAVSPIESEGLHNSKRARQESATGEKDRRLKPGVGQPSRRDPDRPEDRQQDGFHQME
jgi:hypothetical protein